MARYWNQDLRGEGDHATPPTEPLEGLQPLRRDRWEAVMRGQDKVCVTSRRVVMQVGCGTATGWRFTSGAPSEGAQIAYGVCRARLTSGCFLRGSVLFEPAGGVGGDTATPDLAGGSVHMDLTWTAEDTTTETDEIDVSFPTSILDDFDEATGDGEAWGHLYRLDFDILPPVDLTDDAEANRWTISPTVAIDAYQVGGPRIVDFVLYEVPYGVTFESDDTEWSSHVFATGDVDDASQASSPRPRTRRSETSPDGNPRGGTRLTMDVAREQRLRFGPSLLTWGNYQEDTSTFNTGLVALTRTGSSSNLVGLFDSSMTAYDADREGLSVSCGGYARPYRDTNGHVLGTEDAEAAVPVVFRVYGSSDASTVRLRLMTADHSWVEVELTTTTGWHEGWGWLKVGINPSDPVVAQVFVDGPQDAEVFGFQLELMRDY